MESLISEIQIYPERQERKLDNWLKSIKFKLPIIEEDMDLILKNVSLLRRCCGWNEGIANTCREDKHEALF